MLTNKQARPRRALREKETVLAGHSYSVCLASSIHGGHERGLEQIVDGIETTLAGLSWSAIYCTIVVFYKRYGVEILQVFRIRLFLGIPHAATFDSPQHVAIRNLSLDNITTQPRDAAG